MVQEFVVAGAVAVLGIIAAAVYAFRTGEQTEASADIDDDGEDEVNVSFGGEADDADTQNDTDFDDETLGINESEADEEPDEGATPVGDLEGVHPLLEKHLVTHGFETVSDVENASNSELLAVEGVGRESIKELRHATGEDASFTTVQEITGVGPIIGHKLRENNFETVSDVQAASDDELLAVEGIGTAKLAEIRENT